MLRSRYREEGAAGRFRKRGLYPGYQLRQVRSSTATCRRGAPPLDLKQVKSFLAVAKAMHFSRAAKALHLSQPALSTQIRALEAHLGAQLFVRNRRHVSLTPAGEVFWWMPRCSFDKLPRSS